MGFKVDRNVISLHLEDFDSRKKEEETTMFEFLLESFGRECKVIRQALYLTIK